MATKIHFKATTQGAAACAVDLPKADGKVRHNSRSTYATIPASHIVPPDQFRATPEADRCMHCADQFTARMNMRRARNGKPLYANAFTQLLADNTAVA